MIAMLMEFLTSFLALFIIIDPFVSIPIFISLTRGKSRSEKDKEALVASGVALILLIVFLFLGLLILEVMGISLSALQIGGGIIILIMGIQTVMGSDFFEKGGKKKMAGVVIGTPLLCGPGALTTITVLSKVYGFLIPLIAACLVMFLTWIILRFSGAISRKLGKTLVEIMSRVLGVLLTALAIQFIINGVLAIQTVVLI